MIITGGVDMFCLKLFFHSNNKPAVTCFFMLALLSLRLSFARDSRQPTARVLVSQSSKMYLFSASNKNTHALNNVIEKQYEREQYCGPFTNKTGLVIPIREIALIPDYCTGNKKDRKVATIFKTMFGGLALHKL